MGEVANVQQLSPELVIGYVVIMDEKEDPPHRGGGTWIDHFEANLRNIAIRRAPLWNQGLIEGAWLIRINSDKPGQRVLDISATETAGVEFFQQLLAQLFLREPTLKRST